MLSNLFDLLQGLTPSSAADGAGGAAMAEAGAAFNELSGFCSSAGGGVVRQALNAAVRAQLDLYMRDLAAVEREVARDSARPGSAARPREPPPAPGSAPASAPAPWTTRRLAAWCASNVRRLRALQAVVRACEGREGVHLAGCVFACVHDGDPQARALAAAVFAAVARPVALACRAWLRGAAVGGSVPLLRTAAGGDDFFVVRRVDAAPGGGNGDGSGTGSAGVGASGDEATSAGLWGTYCVSARHVPGFLPPSLVRAMFECGRTLRFLQEACRDDEWVAALARKVSEADALGASLPPAASAAIPPTLPSLAPRPGAALVMYSSLPSSSPTAQAATGPSFSSASLKFALSREAQVLAPIANERLLWLLRGKFQLMSHLAAVHRYVLLTQGDFVASLVASIAGELSRPAALVATSKHVIDGIFESAVRASNARLDDRAVLDRVLVHILPTAATSPARSSSTGWDVFCLQYAVDEPVSSIVDAPAQAQCAEAFAFLWLLRRCEHALTAAWLDQAAVHHRLRKSPDARVLLEALHRSHLLRTDMAAFVKTLLAHAMLAVLAPAWTQLHAAMEGAAGMGELVVAYKVYLAAVLEGLFLRSPSGGGEAGAGGTVISAIRRILLLALEYAGAQHRQSSAMLAVAGDADSDTLQLAAALAQHAESLAALAVRFRDAVATLFALDTGSIDVTTREMISAIRARYDFNGAFNKR
jgi:gamma-tubulin complex component 3